MTKTEKADFLLIFRVDRKSATQSPEEMQIIFGQWTAWMRGLKAQGDFVGADRLHDEGKVLRGATVTDGPFVEAKEIMGGYLIISARNLAEATEVAKGCPGLKHGYVVEVRQIEQLPPI
jgi:hypothetical protein